MLIIVFLILTVPHGKFLIYFYIELRTFTNTVLIAAFSLLKNNRTFRNSTKSGSTHKGHLYLLLQLGILHTRERIFHMNKKSG